MDAGLRNCLRFRVERAGRWPCPVPCSGVWAAESAPSELPHPRLPVTILPHTALVRGHSPVLLPGIPASPTYLACSKPVTSEPASGNYVLSSTTPRARGGSSGHTGVSDLPEATHPGFSTSEVCALNQSALGGRALERGTQEDLLEEVVFDLGWN